MSAPTVKYQPPDWLRRYWVGFIVVFTAIGIGSAIGGSISGCWPTVPVAVFVLGAGHAIFWRLYRLALISSNEALLVRNFSSTRRVDRSAISGFQVGGRLTRPMSVTIVLRNGRKVCVDALEYSERGKGRRERLEAYVDELTLWLTNEQR